MKRLSLALVLLAACGGSSDTVDSTSGTDGTSGSDSTTSGSDASSGVDCTSASTTLDKTVCQAQGFLDSLSATQLTTANPAFTDTTDRTRWSNLPTGMVQRGGIQMGTLSTTSQAAAHELMATVLDTDGMSDLDGVRAADDYLNANGGGDGYGSGLYWIGIFGTPSATENWSIMFGGHHMAFNITFVGGVGYTTPNHLGVEPKAAFTENNVTYQPLADEGAAMLAIFTSLSSTDVATGHLSGTFGDVVVGPVEYATGSSAAAKAKYPTGANRTGVLVSSLTSAQQALVTAAIEEWAGNFDSSFSDALIADYTSATAYQDTYIAWGGSGTSPSVDTSGTYFRIDGPRVWIEVACQSGIVFHDATHYHTIYRDKQYDYGNTL
ncbi:MAG TPA: DUF3500 domain-containing protein [Kofleriaceae bacterium]|jgi:hypothetical protein